MLDVLKNGHWAICAGRSEKDSPCLLAFWRQVEGFRYEDLSADLIEVEMFLLNMRYNVALAIEKHKTD